jgi:hypothetical protein
VLDRWADKLDALVPPRFPTFGVGFPHRRYPDCIPVLLERQATFYKKVEECLTDPTHDRAWWGPLRGQPPLRRLPSASFLRVPE